MLDTQISTTEKNHGFNSTQMSLNNKDDDYSPLWMTLMDQSQLVMTIIGLVANMATTLTLIKNGQVGRIIHSTAGFSPLIGLSPRLMTRLWRGNVFRRVCLQKAGDHL